MEKIFVSLDTKKSPSNNPYKICTYLNRGNEGQREWQVTSNIMELNICDQLSKIKYNPLQKDSIPKQLNKVNHSKKDVKVKNRFGIKELKQHVVGREGYLKVKRQKNSLTHDMADLYHSENICQSVQLPNPRIKRGIVKTASLFNI